MNDRRKSTVPLSQPLTEEEWAEVIRTHLRIRITATGCVCVQRPIGSAGMGRSVAQAIADMEGR